MKYVATTSLENDVKTYGYAAAQGTAQTLTVLTDQTGTVTNGAPRIEVFELKSAQVGMNISGSGIVAGTQIIGIETVGSTNYIYLSIAPSATITH